MRKQKQSFSMEKRVMTYRASGAAALCAAVLSTIYGPANAADVPTRTPGQWQLTTVSDSMGMRTVKTCIAATDHVVLGDNAKNCGPVDVKTVANETFVNVTCTAGNGRQKISTLLTGDFSTWYRAVTKITFDPPQDGVSHLGVIVDGKYLGKDCEADAQGAEK